jgi:methyl-accepting chemotaxis protein
MLNRFQNLKVSTKLFASFGLVLVLAAVIAGFSVLRLGDLSAVAANITGNWLPGMDQLANINSVVSDVRIAELRAIAADSPDEVERHLKDAQDGIDEISREIREYERSMSGESERQLWTDWQTGWHQYLDVHARGVGLLHEKKAADAEALWGESDQKLFDSFGGALDKAIDQNRNGARAATTAADSTYHTSRVLILLVLGIAVALGIAVPLMVSRSLADPLNRIVDVFRSMAGGRLDNDISTQRHDEIGAVLTGLGQLQDNLRKLIAESTSQLEAISKTQAMIEFQLDGTIVSANENFLRTMGYTLDEIRGGHHSMFVTPEERNSAEYQQFWERLRRGEHQKTRYHRLGKGGRDVWIEAFYSPVTDANGTPLKVIKYATEVTEQVVATRQMEQAVLQTQAAIKAATDGDLSVRVNAHDKVGNVKAMAESINSLLANMTEMVTHVKTAAADVHRGAEEISQGNANLSQRTEEQSSSLEETASSMEEMTSTVKQNADNAGQANQLATAARDQAEKGGAVTAKAVSAMTEINDASRKIADIIGVIDEIAFQTNLLALNAAVEAARAGEQGRGFAVVASEVRSLAGRSATAAKEIKDLIQDSVKKVEDGSVLVTQSGQTLEQIVGSVKKVSDIVAEIAAASREQSSGIEQVSKAVTQMDQMTQQNAALVEEATAASQSMADQARKLNETMARYRVGSEAYGAQVASGGASAAPVALTRAAERRGTTRPWTGKTTKPAPKMLAAKPVATAKASGDDSEWQEF